MNVPTKMNKYLYALEKLAARESFMDFIEDWGITEEEYEEIAEFFKAQGIKGYITR